MTNLSECQLCCKNRLGFWEIHEIKGDCVSQKLITQCTVCKHKHWEIIKHSQITLQVETGGNEAQWELFKEPARSIQPPSRAAQGEYCWTKANAKGRELGGSLGNICV